MTGRWSRRSRLGAAAGDDRGSVPIELSLGVGLLVFPVALLVVLFPTWSERMAMARVAAQEAARVLALSDSIAAGTAQAAALVEQIAANHAMTADLVGLDVDIPDVDGDGAVDRGATVTAAVHVRVPLVAVPFMGGAGGFTVTGRHSEAVDAYRSIPPPP